jgi:hypothetical protein
MKKLTGRISIDWHEDNNGNAYEYIEFFCLKHPYESLESIFRNYFLKENYELKVKIEITEDKITFLKLN